MKMFDAGKTRMIGLPYGEKNCDDMLSCFHLIPERHGRTDRQTDRQTDGRTDRFAISISRDKYDQVNENENSDQTKYYKSIVPISSYQIGRDQWRGYGGWGV